jgi:hypothetical protein
VPTGLLALDCPGVDGQEQPISLGGKTWKYKVLCGQNISKQDFGAVVVYSLHDCLQACAAHNFYSGKDECKAVHFDTDMPTVIPLYYGNCWLKTATGPTDKGGGGKHAAAVLVGA